MTVEQVSSDGTATFVKFYRGPLPAISLQFQSLWNDLTATSVTPQFPPIPPALDYSDPDNSMYGAWDETSQPDHPNDRPNVSDSCCHGRFGAGESDRARWQPQSVRLSWPQHRRLPGTAGFAVGRQRHSVFAEQSAIFRSDARFDADSAGPARQGLRHSDRAADRSGHQTCAGDDHSGGYRLDHDIGENGASIVTGSPTANSFATQAVNGASTARLQLSGSWVGTLVFEQSIDGGTTFGAMACHYNGTIYSGSSITGNGIFDCEVAGATHIRVRATSFVGGGTAVLTQTLTSFAGVVKILNSVALKDNASGSSLTIKPASTAPSATDPAAVTTLSPNTGEVGSPASGVTQPSGRALISGWLSGIYKTLTGTLTTSDSGAAGSGISQPAGGTGVSGWLSGIYKALTNPLQVTPLGVTSTDDSGTIATGEAINRRSPRAARARAA